MGDTTRNLDVFGLRRGKDRLEGTAYFELHPGELPRPLACWLPGSLFLRDAAFDFLAACFERANKRFDYFSFVRFEAAQVDVLLCEMSSFLTELSAECAREVVFSRYTSVLTTRSWDEVGTTELRSALIPAVQGVSEFVRQECLPSRRCLWVLGM